MTSLKTNPERIFLQWLLKTYPNKKRKLIIMNPLKHSCKVQFCDGDVIELPYQVV